MLIIFKVGSGDGQNASSFWLVQMFARRQIGELLQVFGAQWRGDIVFLGEPFAEINQLAAMRTERAVFVCKPITAFLARRAFDLCRGAHVQFEISAGFLPPRLSSRRQRRWRWCA